MVQRLRIRLLLTVLTSGIIATGYGYGQSSIVLQFNSLPSAQGWTYFEGGDIPESSVFSATGTSLLQNTIGTGFTSSPNYAMFNIVDGARPFTLTVQARMTAEEGTDPGGFFFDVRTASPNQEYEIEFTTSSVSDPLGNTFAVDTTVFHTYVLIATPGSNYSLYIDGTLSLAGPFSATGGAVNAVQFGDGNTTKANAQAEIKQLVFTTGLQPGCNPLTGPTQVGTPYSATCTPQNGTPPYNWTISSGTLPDGLKLTPDCTTATVCGTPTTPGDYNYTVQVADSSVPQQTAQQAYSGTITLNCAQPTALGRIHLKEPEVPPYSGYAFEVEILPTACDFTGTKIAEIVHVNEQKSTCPFNNPIYYKQGTVLHGTFNNEYVDDIGYKLGATTTSCIFVTRQNIGWFDETTKKWVGLTFPDSSGNKQYVGIDITGSSSAETSCLLWPLSTAQNKWICAPGQPY